jgi:hypothetical protein
MLFVLPGNMKAWPVYGGPLIGKYKKEINNSGRLTRVDNISITGDIEIILSFSCQTKKANIVGCQGVHRKGPEGAEGSIAKKKRHK